MIIITQFIEMPDGEYIPLNLYSKYKVATFFLKDFLSFEGARKFARSLDLKSSTEWHEYYKLNNPCNVPSNPGTIYKEEWNGWSDFLGTLHFRGDHFLPISKARKFVRSLNLSGETEWRKYCKSGKKPDNIPADPHKFYRNKGWIDWYNWIGKKRKTA